LDGWRSKGEIPLATRNRLVAVALLAFVLMGVSNSGKALLVLIFGAKDQCRCH